MTKKTIVSLLFLVICASSALALSRNENVVPNAGFEEDASWTPVGKGFAYDATQHHSGGRSMRCENGNTDEVSGAMVAVVIDPPVNHAFCVSGWSRADHTEVVQNYDLYLDVYYEDGTPLWGQKAEFKPGTHGWEHSELVFPVTKPVKRIEVYALFRKAKGTVWFDDIEVTLAPFKFTGVSVSPSLFGTGAGLLACTSLPADWSVRSTLPEGCVVSECSGTEPPIRMLESTPFSKGGRFVITAKDRLLGETIEQRVEIPADAPGTGPLPYRVWNENAMTRIMPYALPPDSPRNAIEVSVSLARNEYESFQLAVLPSPGVALKDVAVDPPVLRRANDGATLSPSSFSWYQEGYVRVDQLIPHPADPTAAAGWWPDALLPVDTFNVAPGFIQALWFTVHAPADALPGVYTGEMAIRPEGQPETRVTLRVEVYDLTLPVRGHMKTAFALMDGFLERVYGKPLDPELRRRYGAYLLEHRLNPDDISRTAPPDLDDLKYYANKGINAFNVLNMVDERGNAAWVCYSELPVYTPEFLKHIQDRLDPYVEGLRKTGLAPLSYIYTFDERGKEFYPVIRDFFGMVKHHYPELHTLTTAYLPQDPAVLDDLNVDWACPLTPAYNFEMAEQCRAAGHQVWAYVCMGPRYPHANWLCDHPLIEARVLWWQAFQQKMDGLLYWGLNIWDRPGNDKPIAPPKGPLLDWSITTGGDYAWLHGDGRLLYAGPNGPIGSIRLEAIRDGLEDYEYLWLLGDAAGARDACLPVTHSMTDFTRDPSVLAKARADIAARIVASVKPGV
jgi:hypothetical protein